MTDALLLCLPMRAQFLIELPPTFFGEKDSGFFELDTPRRAWNVVGEPMLPFQIEIHIVRSPDYECWRVQFLQSILNGYRVAVVESREEALQIKYPLFVLNKRAKVFFDHVVAHLLGMFVGGPQRLL